MSAPRTPRGFFIALLLSSSCCLAPLNLLARPPIHGKHLQSKQFLLHLSFCALLQLTPHHSQKRGSLYGANSRLRSARRHSVVTSLSSFMEGLTPMIVPTRWLDSSSSTPTIATSSTNWSYRQALSTSVAEIIIGLNLGVVGDEFSTLYPVLVFHQSFEGLGLGARTSAIPLKPRSVLRWALCALHGFTTPILVAIGLGMRTTYKPNSYTANAVSRTLDATSAGILF